jgi:hypothetical protein
MPIRREMRRHVAKLLGKVNSFAKAHPDWYFGFVGYSQGQQVVREAFAQMTGPEQLQTAFIVGFGDPLWSSRQPQIDRGDGNRLGGIYYASARLDSALHVPDVHIPAKLPPRVKDWCLRGDVVANWAWSNYAQYGTATMHLLTPGADTSPAPPTSRQHLQRAAQIAQVTRRDPEGPLTTLLPAKISTTRSVASPPRRLTSSGARSGVPWPWSA